MGKIADALRGVALPEQKLTQMLRLDVHYTEVEVQLESFKDQNSSLKDKNKKLEEQLKVAQEKNERLKNQLQAHAANKDKSIVHADKRDHVEEALLRAIHDLRAKGSSGVCKSEYLTSIVKAKADRQLTTVQANVMLRRMQKVGLVVIDSWHDTWHLTQEGDEYVVFHKLDRP